MEQSPLAPEMRDNFKGGDSFMKPIHNKYVRSGEDLPAFVAGSSLENRRRGSYRIRTIGLI